MYVNKIFLDEQVGTKCAECFIKVRRSNEQKLPISTALLDINLFQAQCNRIPPSPPSPST